MEQDERHGTSSTRVRDQPQLTTESGTTWVVVAAASFGLLGAMLILLGGPTDVTVAACTVMGVLLVSMVIVRMSVRPVRVRLIVLACLYSALLAVSVVATFLAVTGGRP